MAMTLAEYAEGASVPSSDVLDPELAEDAQTADPGGGQPDTDGRKATKITEAQRPEGYALALANLKQLKRALRRQQKTLAEQQAAIEAELAKLNAQEAELTQALAGSSLAAMRDALEMLDTIEQVKGDAVQGSYMVLKLRWLCDRHGNDATVMGMLYGATSGITLGDLSQQAQLEAIRQRMRKAALA